MKNPPSTTGLSPEERRRLLESLLRKKAERAHRFPLSFTQQRLWLLDRLAPENPAYNIPMALRLSGPIDLAVLDRAMEEVVTRHETLRTKIDTVDGQPWQVIAPPSPQKLSLIDLSDLDPAQREAEAVSRAVTEARRPFRLDEGSLFRAVLLRLSPVDHVLVVVIHHIIADDWSMGVLFRELAALYHAFTTGHPSPLPPMAIQYADYAVWQRQHLQGETLDRLLDYWCNRLKGLATLELPTDRPRPQFLDSAGATIGRVYSSALTERLKELGRREGATLYMTLLAAFQTLLHRHSGQEDIVVGSPIAGRLRQETEGLVGFLANTLVMRNDLSGNPSFRELLGRVRQRAMEAFQHQEMPFERLVEALNPPRDTSRHPLFQVLFTLQNAPWPKVRLADLTLSVFPLDTGTAKFDLWLSMRETDAGLMVDVEYSVALFDAATIQRMLDHLETLLEGVAEDPDRPIAQLPLLTSSEKQQILGAWNDTAKDYHSTDCLHQLVEAQVARTPHAVALDFEGRQLTYAELNRRANQLARHLLACNVAPDTPVGVCLERSGEMVVSLLAILKAGGAYAPLDPDYPADRLAFMIADSRPAVVLTTRDLASRLPEGETPCICLDEIADDLERQRGDNLPLRGVLDDVAYVIYTSGSTGMPKGVRNTHRGICNRLLWMQDAYGLTPDDRVMQKTPFSFDVSVWEFFWPLITGARLVVARPGGHKDPRYLARLIVDHRITTIHFVPSMLAVFLEDAEAVRCKCLKRVMCSGEALPYEVQQRFFARLDAELHNLYGPTEAAVDVTYWHCRPNEAGIVPIGRPIANMQCLILDTYQNLVPVGCPGELHLGGVGLARDYLNRPELTAEKFIPNPMSSQPGARLYRTGDLCRWLPDGNIEFLGRIDHQVKLRGFRIELGEIEAVLARHSGVRQVVVVVRQDQGGDRRLVAYFVPDPAEPPTADDLRGFLREKLPDYMIPTVFMALESMPLSSNGKVDRKALPAVDDQRPEMTVAYEAPRNEVERQLAEIWQEILHVQRVGIHDNFFSLGGHSLLAAQVASQVAHRLHVDLPLREIFESPTIGQLAERVAAFELGEKSLIGPRIPRVPHEGPMLPSFTQEALWFLDQLERGRATYTIYSPLRIRGPLKIATAERALNEIVRRHESLRTTFPEVDGRPMQVIAPYEPRPLAVVDLSELPEADQQPRLRRWIADEMERPIDLQNGPLIRVTLLRLGAEDHVAMVSAHHMIYDGWSMAVLLRELSTLYTAFERGSGSPLPELPIQYADFVAWQRERLQGEGLERLRSYWVKQLTGVSPLELPLDHARPNIRTTRGATQAFDLTPSTSEALMQYCRQEGLTPFMVLLAAFEMLLQRYSGQDDFAIGSPVANRARPETEALIGYFVNVVVLRNDLSGEPSFRDVLRRLRQTTLDAYDHQEMTLDQVVAAVNPPRDMSRHPLFQVMFALQNIELPQLDAFGLAMTPLEDGPTPRASYFDLTLAFWQEGKSFHGELNYSTDLFDAPTIDRMGKHYEVLLASALDQPDRPVAALPVLDEAERQQVVVNWNATAARFPRDRRVHELCAEHARRAPQSTAVVLDGQNWTYAELNERANQLARFLQSQGVGREVRVGICMERSPELIMAVLAVMKAGGAYVPLDPAYTREAEERVRFILENAGVSLVLTTSSLAASLPETAARLVLLDGEAAFEIASQPRGEKGTVPLCAKHPSGRSGKGGLSPSSHGSLDDLAYILYTSGSTGRPKGVMVTQGNLVNAYFGWEEAYRLGSEVHSHLQMASFGFDVFGGDLVRALCSGGKLVICRKETLLEPKELLGLLRHEEVDAAEFVPLVLRNLVQYLEETGQALDSMRLVAVGSDIWYAGEHERTRRVLGPATRLVNSYGLTETTIDSSYFEGDASALAEGAMTPIGRPFGNVRLYVLDGRMQAVPIGVPGELYIGGPGVSRGYLDAESNAARFVQDPFVFEPGARLCRTGDRARWRADGQIEFLGRADNQVKIRGFRVEPGEVEQLLGEHPQIAQAAVAARARTAGDLRLVAYVVGKPEAALDVAELRQFLASRLPDYMVPSAIVVLETLPATSSGKVDRKALPMPDWSSATGTEYVAPRTPEEEQLAGVWAEVLNVERVGATDNFFDLGGNSLLALRLISRVRAAFSVDLPLVALFTSPTVGGLWSTIARLQAAGQGAAISGEPVDWDAEIELDPTIRVTSDLLPAAPEPARILLTGATGFLGAFLLRELLERTNAEVYCLVRARNAEDGKAKIARNLLQYEIEVGALSERIIPVCGDLAEPALGLSPDDYANLAANVDVIYHNGAYVNFIFPYETLKPANVTGTVEVLRLATQVKVKPLHFVSTVSVFDAPEYGAVGRIDEEQPLTVVGGLQGGYAQSKCVAEILVREAGSRGLPVVIYRPGRVTADSVSGAESLADYTTLLLRLCIEMKMAPRSEDRVDMTPVDYVARAIAALSEKAESVGRTFHLIQPQPVALRDVYRAIRQCGYDLQEVPPEAWHSAAIQWGMQSKDESFTAFAHWLMLMLPVRDPAQAEAEPASQPMTVACATTVHTLDPMGVICPVLDVDLLTKQVMFLVRKKVLTPPERSPVVRRSLVPLRASETGQPLFCIHGLGGHVAVFLPLAQRLGQSRPVYGLQGLGLDPGQEPHDRIEAMAACYVSEIQEVQPHGPYLLGGWSMGGLIALEAAGQLRAAGEEVALVAMFDTHLSMQDFEKLELDDETVLRWIAPQLNVSPAQLKGLPLDQQWQRIAELADGAKGIGVAEIRRLAAVCKAHLRALACYKPRPYVGRAVLFSADNGRGRPDRRWDSLCRGLEVESVSGNHYSMLRKPHVEVLAGRLNVCLEVQTGNH